MIDSSLVITFMPIRKPNDSFEPLCGGIHFIAVFWTQTHNFHAFWRVFSIQTPRKKPAVVVRDQALQPDLDGGNDSGLFLPQELRNDHGWKDCTGSQ